MKIYTLSYTIIWNGEHKGKNRKEKRVFKSEKDLKEHIKNEMEKKEEIEKKGADERKSTDYSITLYAEEIDTEAFSIKRKFYYVETKRHAINRPFNEYYKNVYQIDSNGKETIKDPVIIKDEILI